MPPRDTKELAHSLINRAGSNERPVSVSVYLVITCTRDVPVSNLTWDTGFLYSY
jgi:hypothetical protein